jgi:hypothetical protein
MGGKNVSTTPKNCIPRQYVGAVFDRPPRYNAQLYGIYRRARLASAARPYGLTADYGDSLSPFYGRQQCIVHTQKLHPQTYVGAVFDRPRYNTQIYVICRRCVVCYDIPVDDQAGERSSPLRTYGGFWGFIESILWAATMYRPHPKTASPDIVGAVFDRPPRYNA